MYVGSMLLCQITCYLLRAIPSHNLRAYALSDGMAPWIAVAYVYELVSESVAAFRSLRFPRAVMSAGTLVCVSGKELPKCGDVPALGLIDLRCIQWKLLLLNQPQFRHSSNNTATLHTVAQGHLQKLRVASRSLVEIRRRVRDFESIEIRASNHEQETCYQKVVSNEALKAIVVLAQVSHLRIEFNTCPL